MKYIIIEKSEFDDQVSFHPVIFSSMLNHSDIAKHTLHLMGNMWPYGKFEVTSAGFYNEINGMTYGRSETLGIKSYEHDAVIIKRSEYFTISDKRPVNKF